MVEVKRKKGETNESVVKRFLKRFQESGKGRETRRRRYHAGKKSKTKRHDSALRRVQMRAKYEYQAKTGQLKEEPRRGAPRH